MEAKKDRSENLYEKARRRLELGDGSKCADAIADASQVTFVRDLYAGLIEQSIGDPVEGLLESTNRGLVLLQASLSPESEYGLSNEDVNNHILDLRRRVDAARVLYLRLLEEMLACAPAERAPAKLVLLKGKSRPKPRPPATPGPFAGGPTS